MKRIKGIVFRNTLSAAGIALIILITNIILFISLIVASSSNKNMYACIREVGEGFYYEGEELVVDSESEKNIDTYFKWAMFLDDDGNVIWSRNLPPDFSLSYTSSDIASFTRWYLNDYPVNVWQNEYGLLVLGSEKDTLWKHQIQFSISTMNNLSLYIGVFFLTNFAVAIILSLVFGLRFFKSLRKVADGINDIANKKRVVLKMNGQFKSLGNDLNKASEEIIRQQNIIDKRDNARNNWIIGVSHDIRTPLSMIMGYSSTLENNINLDDDIRKKAKIIRTQSEKIKELVNDLNLTVKLEYEMEPLNLESLCICSILRKVCVDYLNNMYDDRYSINLEIEDNAQNYKIDGDSRLIERVFNNIIGNSINHNENGCNINITVNKNKENNKLHIEICDDGSGFEEAKLEELNNSSELPTGKNHGLGLFIVKQIVQVHGGTIIFGNGLNGVKIEIEL